MKTLLHKNFTVLFLFLLTLSNYKVVITQDCKTYSNNEIRIIPDRQRALSDVVVDLVGTVTAVKIVNFAGYHTCLSDINLELTSPAGTNVLFVNFGNCCGGGQPFKTKFADDGTTDTYPCPMNDSIFHKPTHGNLSIFNGEQAAGTWTLLFDDAVGADCGFLCGWSLEVSTGGVCTGVASDEGNCPVLTRSYSCSEIQGIFANGGTLTVGECTTFSNNSINYIPDNSQTVSTVTVTMAGNVTDLNIVNLVGYHTFPNDLQMTLTSPAGTSVIFIYNSFSCGPTTINIKFDEAGADAFYPCPLNDGAAYKTINGDFADFIGQVAAGTWTLTINDNITGDCGFLCGWSLEISTGASCTGSAPDAGTCPPLKDIYNCPELKSIFSNGNTVIPAPDNSKYIVNRHILIKDEIRDSFLGTFYSFHWVNYSNSNFDSNQGVLAIDNSVKYIYKIINNNVKAIDYGSTSLEARYSQFVINSDAINVKRKNYVAWLVDLDTNFCNCSNSNDVGNGIGISNVKFTHCEQGAKIIVEDLKKKYTNVAILVQLENEQLVYLIGSTKFKHVYEFKLFFDGVFLAEHLQYCQEECSV